MGELKRVRVRWVTRGEKWAHASAWTAAALERLVVALGRGAMGAALEAGAAEVEVDGVAVGVRLSGEVVRAHGGPALPAVETARDFAASVFGGR